jgi:hypothetical protein
MERVIKGKATLDPGVIEAWSSLLAIRKRRASHIYALAGALVLAWLIFGILTGLNVGMLFTGVAIILVGAGSVDSLAIARCPHCGEDVLQPLGRRESIYTIEWCQRCYYWLRKPW